MKKTKTILDKNESKRYLANAKELLHKSPVEGTSYSDIKYVREACSTAYMAMLIAIDNYLLGRGVVPKNLTDSVDGYRAMLRKYASVHNGKLLKDFDSLYDELHIAGYYKGLLKHVTVLNVIFKETESFIKRLN